MADLPEDVRFAGRQLEERVFLGQALAEGGERCDFRFKKGGKTNVPCHDR